MTLRIEDEIAIKEAKILLLNTIYNGFVALNSIEQSEKSIQQKIELIRLYEKNTKNKVNQFSSYIELCEKVKASITNITNQIEKQKDSLYSKQEKSIQNSFDIVAGVVATLQVPLDIKTISVSEFLAYEKIAIKKSKANEK